MHRIAPELAMERSSMAQSVGASSTTGAASRKAAVDEAAKLLIYGKPSPARKLAIERVAAKVECLLRGRTTHRASVRKKLTEAGQAAKSLARLLRDPDLDELLHGAHGLLAPRGSEKAHPTGFVQANPEGLMRPNLAAPDQRGPEGLAQRSLEGLMRPSLDIARLDDLARNAAWHLGRIRVGGGGDTLQHSQAKPSAKLVCTVAAVTLILMTSREWPGKDNPVLSDLCDKIWQAAGGKPQGTSAWVKSIAAARADAKAGSEREAIQLLSARMIVGDALHDAGFVAEQD
jgi:hypothetical protein